MALTDQDRTLLPRLTSGSSKIASSTHDKRFSARCTGDAVTRYRRSGLEHADRGPSASACRHPARRSEGQQPLDDRFTAENGLVIAPHGKTTMAPQLFDLQVADGAWAITVATTQQLAVCRQFGVRRVIIANQPIGAQSVDACFRALRAGRESSSIVWPIAWRERRSSPKVRSGIPPPGKPTSRPRRDRLHGRTRGCANRRKRSRSLARSPQPRARGRGVRVFEGLLPDPASADSLIEEVAAIAAYAPTRKTCCRPGRR